MKFTDPRVIEPAIVAEISGMFARGLDHDEVIARMRALGLHKIECMKLFREYGGVTLGEAKDIVHLSPVWADRYESDEAFHDVAERAAEIALGKERTAA